jgi:hypothetical protein
VIVFCLVGGILLAVDFGSYYLGLAGFSPVSFSYWQANDLWWILYKAAEHSVGGALAASVSVYLAARKKKDESESNVAA